MKISQKFLFTSLYNFIVCFMTGFQFLLISGVPLLCQNSPKWLMLLGLTIFSVINIICILMLIFYIPKHNFFEDHFYNKYLLSGIISFSFTMIAGFVIKMTNNSVSLSSIQSNGFLSVITMAIILSWFILMTLILSSPLDD